MENENLIITGELQHPLQTFPSIKGMPINWWPLMKDENLSIVGEIQCSLLVIRIFENIKLTANMPRQIHACWNLILNFPWNFFLNFHLGHPWQSTNTLNHPLLCQQFIVNAKNYLLFWHNIGKPLTPLGKGSMQINILLVSINPVQYFDSPLLILFPAVI